MFITCCRSTPSGAFCGASLVFYCVGGGKTVLYVFYTAAIVYVCGLLLGHYNDLRRAAPKEERKAVTARISPVAGLLSWSPVS